VSNKCFSYTAVFRRHERAIAIGASSPRTRVEAERSLSELVGLSEAAGAMVVSSVVQERKSPDPATFFGLGKVEELAKSCDEAEIDLVVVDHELSPTQLKNLECVIGLKVVDRTQLILDIFAKRARTREGKLQVELAQLRYLLPRLVGATTALSRLGGGIGTRGPGETKLETDRRRIRHRIGVLEREIAVVRQRRAQLRARRHKASIPTVALVGYTNAGKTTLFNKLANENAQVSDSLFMTLDPLVRHVSFPDRRELRISDTVGFIDRLPHSLVAAFRATLEEVTSADLLLHVIDASDCDTVRRIRAVNRVLDEVGAKDIRTIEVFNKCDVMTLSERKILASRYPSAFCASGLTGEGVGPLLVAVTTSLSLEMCRVVLKFNRRSESDQNRMARLYRHARIFRHENFDSHVSIEADVPRRMLEELKREISAEA